jgi:hypothetical protein
VQEDYELGHFCTPPAAYPPVEDVLKMDQCGDSLDAWDRAFPLENSPAAQNKRAELVEHYRAQLAKCAARYEQIRTKGASALSWYDRNGACAGNLEDSLRTAVALTFNHTIYYLRCIAAARRVAPALVAFFESGATLAPQRETYPASNAEQYALFS